MAKKNSKKRDEPNKKSKSKNSDGIASRISTETRHGIGAIVSFLLGLFFIVSAWGGAGAAGHFFYLLFTALFGVGYFLVPVLCIFLGVSYVQSVRPNIALIHTVSGLVFLLSGLAIIDAASPAMHAGGYVGTIAAYPFIGLFDTTMAIVVLGALFIISLLVLFNKRPELMPLLRGFISLFKRRKKDEDEEEYYDEEDDVTPEEIPEEKEEIPEPVEVPEKKSAPIKPAEEDEFESSFKASKARKANAYVPPPLSLLEEDKGKPNTGDVKANSNIIRRTLANFGIEVEMDEITVGPSVTRYALKPAEGVKLSRIVGLQNDLALALAAHPLRIEAPIPGKSLVGIEIPNKVKSTVGLATLLADEKFQAGTKPLLVALGRNISGKSMFGNLAKMPHVLIAGTTGSGKSVTIHSIITSLFYRNGPEDLRFIMVDPKRVELTLYNKVPHLLTPVITDAKKTILALKWAAKEMDRRYDILETEACRDIESYHSNIFDKSKKSAKTGEDSERMPYIVIVIDELADIMSSYPRELESAIVRLAQMSRAVGIHLILSTQRPEVNVITGLIKANIPARVALKVASQIDSRTILDAGGAEKLLGAGDMLYSSGDAQPERLQSAFISEGEVKKVVKYLADRYQDDMSSELNLTGTITHDKSIFESTIGDENEADDDLYEEARQIVIETGKASTSYLQRKLGVGYARAARLIDMLEEHGVVGPGNGAKPRDVLEKPAGGAPEGFM